MMQPPKDWFAKGVHAKKFKGMVMDEAFVEATNAAMLVMLDEQPKIGSSPNQSVDFHQQMVGARKYLETLCTIWEPEKEPEQKKERGLNYAAGV